MLQWILFNVVVDTILCCSGYYLMNLKGDEQKNQMDEAHLRKGGKNSFKITHFLKYET